ncbi:MAG: zinc-ribbon domain-containing protein [Proteobacteria bacterium]|nr:zinc-ribbon domain-containing protein [Pseudomonadota bacterium]
MIIQCPSCNTKFSLEDNQLAKLDNPRFHCSRCNHYFNLLNGNNTEASNPDTELTSDSVNNENLENIDDYESPEENSNQLEMNFAEESLAQEMNSTPSFTSTQDENFLEKDETKFVADWPTASPSNTYEADLSKHFNIKDINRNSQNLNSAYIEKLNQSEDLSKVTTPFISEKATTNPLKGSERIDTKFTLGLSTKMPTFDSEKNEMLKSAAEATGKFVLSDLQPPPVAEQNQSNNDDRLQVEKKVLSTNKKLLQRKQSNYLSQASNLLVVSSLPFLVLLFILGWSKRIDNTPLFFKEILNLGSETLIKLPPQGLQLVELTSDVMSLDNGKRVLTIIGNLYNATNRTFNKIKIDSRLFNAENREIERLISDAKTPLISAKLQALTTESIKEMQQNISDSDRNSKIQPNEKIPFKVVFSDFENQSSIDDIKWFSAKVYSLENVY